MRKIISAAALLALSLELSGCADMAGMVDRTADDIRRSKYQAEFVSTKPSKDVTGCMMEATNNYKSETGYTIFSGNFSASTVQDYGQMQEILNRTPGSPAFGGGEIKFLIENLSTPAGGTKSHLWSTPNIPFGMGSQGFMDRLVGAVKPCLGDNNASTMNNPTAAQQLGTGANSTAESRTKEGPADKLEQLKGLLDRGVITKEDFEKKKKEILDRF